MPTSHNQRLVTVFGGSGFLGRHVVRALAKEGFRIRVAVRRPDLAGHLQPMGNVGQIHAVQANLRHSDSVFRALEGADCVINLTGILFPAGKQTFDAIHWHGAETIAQAALQAGCQQLIHVSAIGADTDSSSQYAKTKALGEEATLLSFPNAVILRPSIVFGPEDDFFNRFASLAALFPALPLIGGGKTRFQPVYVGDVAQAVLSAVRGGAKPGTVYELGGPSIMSFKEVLEKVRLYSDRSGFYISLPFWLAKIQAFFMQLFPSPMLTVDQVRLLQTDNVVNDAAIEEGRTLDGLGIDHPIAVDAIVPQYLVRFRPKGQFSMV